ncbi:MAG TPA: glycosyltransferase family protein [Candidatus Nanoarchaeia archaeon]|nr:glycosyltransferase family protein [Candidatus Nanoarchaeia archaeon]
MNILYGVCGEGLGHSSRAIAIADHLIKKGHKVKIITYGQAYTALKGKYDLFKAKGLHLIFKGNVLEKRRTLTYNLRHFTRNLKRLKEFDRLVKGFRPDVCITDMEAIVPALSRWYSLPLISFDNQHRICNCHLKVPKRYYPDYLLAKEVIKTITRGVKYFIITDFVHLPVKKRYESRTVIVPPVIRKEIIDLKTRNSGKILVYLTKKNSPILKVLSGIKQQFVIYGYNQEKRKKNLTFRKRDSFLSDLASCRAIIASAGYTLMSEALYLKKPYLALPLEGHFEQAINAFFLKEAGFGDYSENLTEKDVIYFMYKLEDYRRSILLHNFDSNLVFNAIDMALKSV